MVEVRLLGPVELNDAGRAVEAGPPQLRLALAALAVDAGRPVPTEILMYRMWDDPPAGARRTLHVAISRLLRVLKSHGVALVRRSGGYVLELDSEQVDAHRLTVLAARRDEESLRAAAALCRGDPLTGLAGAWARVTREALRREHLRAVVAWAAVAADPAEPLPALTLFAAEHPLDEALAVALIRSLRAAGHRAEALRAYNELRRALRDELGVEPSAELREMHVDLLSAGPAGDEHLGSGTRSVIELRG